MRKALTLILSIAIFGIFAAVVVAAVGPSDGTSTLPTETNQSSTAPVDISGPCDEAEHAADPRCAGVQVPRAPTPAQDISGPCDEAEHANDPRCIGAGVDDDGDFGDDDSRGPGPGDHDDLDDHDGDDLDDDDSSGPGPGDDDDLDDHGGDDFDDDSSASGPGGGGNSGPG